MKTATVAIISATGSCCISLCMVIALTLYACMYQLYLKNCCILMVGNNATIFFVCSGMLVEYGIFLIFFSHTQQDSKHGSRK